MTTTTSDSRQDRATPAISTVNAALKRIRNMVAHLSPYYVGRSRKCETDGQGQWDEVLFLMSVAVVAGEPMLILGEPGTGKSDMIVRFVEASGVNRYFEYMLTMFTEPGEILGPVDIQALKHGSYERILKGRVADSEVVFLDEIFKGNSAVLNLLLTLMNEKKIYQGTEILDLRRMDERLLAGFFAASNEIPDNSEIVALKDRFPIKVWVDPVAVDELGDLIRAGTRNDIERQRGVRPWADRCSLDDFLTVRRYLFDTYINTAGDEQSELHFSEPMDRLFRELIVTLRDEHRLRISDRQIVKLYRLVATRAYLERGAKPANVRPRDLRMLAYTAEEREAFERARAEVEKAIRETEPHAPGQG
jgi:MoxR-like ATPase